MEGVTETLAGRVGILELSGLSYREVNNLSYKEETIPNSLYLERTIQSPSFDLWEFIFRGDMPELYKNINISPSIYYSSYVKTYIERDVRSIINIKDLDAFSRFMISLASRSGSLLNYNAVANEVGKDLNTIKSWTKILETSGIIAIIKPFTNNEIKRTVTTPVIYFLNTGLLTSKETLMNGAFSGQALETHVVSEIIKSFKNNGYLDVPISFYRDYDGNEIDLIIESNGVLYPLEIKKTMYPKIEMAKAFKKIENALGFKKGTGLILSLFDKKLKLNDSLYSFPIYNL